MQLSTFKAIAPFAFFALTVQATYAEAPSSSARFHYEGTYLDIQGKIWNSRGPALDGDGKAKAEIGKQLEKDPGCLVKKAKIISAALKDFDRQQFNTGDRYKDSVVFVDRINVFQKLQYTKSKESLAELGISVSGTFWFAAPEEITTHELYKELGDIYPFGSAFKRGQDGIVYEFDGEFDLLTSVTDQDGNERTCKGDLSLRDPGMKTRNELEVIRTKVVQAIERIKTRRHAEIEKNEAERERLKWIEFEKKQREIDVKALMDEFGTRDARESSDRAI